MAPSSPQVALRRVLGLNNGSIAAIRVSIDNTLKMRPGTVPPMIPCDKSASRYDGDRQGRAVGCEGELGENGGLEPRQILGHSLT